MSKIVVVNHLTIVSIKHYESPNRCSCFRRCLVDIDTDVDDRSGRLNILAEFVAVTATVVFIAFYEGKVG